MTIYACSTCGSTHDSTVQGDTCLPTYSFDASAVTLPSQGHLVFMGVGAEEYVRFEPGGKVYVRGELVDDNKEIYEQIKRWLASTSASDNSRFKDPFDNE